MWQERCVECVECGKIVSFADADIYADRMFCSTQCIETFVSHSTLCKFFRWIRNWRVV